MPFLGWFIPHFVFFSILIGLLGFVWSLTFSNLAGAPFVPTPAKLVDKILAEANLKKGQIFIDLGSGDGGVVRKAVASYQVIGLGIEINPFLVFFARIKNKVNPLKNLRFERKNILKADLAKADVIFIYLKPEINFKLKSKFEKECQKGTLVISHRFEIEGWKNKLIKTVGEIRTPTYYYLT
jgi:hypothetical protein